MMRERDAQGNITVYHIKWLAYPAYALFFMMLFVPTTYQMIKAVFLATVMAALGIVVLMHGKLHLHVSILLWTLLMVASGAGFMALGAANNTPGALKVGSVYLLWPLVYTILISGISDKKILDGIFRVMVFSLVAISLYSISYLLSTLGWLPESLYFELDMGQGFGVYEGYVEYNLYNISSLNFLVPFLVAMVFTWTKGSGLPISMVWLWFSCLLGIVVAVLSGRRAVWLILLISPLLVTVARLSMPRHFRRTNSRRFKGVLFALSMILGILFFYGSHVAGLDASMIWARLGAGFDFLGSGTESPRAEQFAALLNEWQQNPLFGAGHGASATGSLRSIDMPWAYELSYLALLFQTGLIGVLIYSAGIVWIFWMGTKVMRSGHWLGQYMLPVLVGTASFLIANATNPYLAKFDYIWVIFLPAALVNIWLLDQGKITPLQKKPCPDH